MLKIKLKNILIPRVLSSMQFSKQKILLHLLAKKKKSIRLSNLEIETIIPLLIFTDYYQKIQKY